MHEAALAQGIVDIVIERAHQDAFRRAKVVHIELGALAPVMAEALVAGFFSASLGTPAEGAELDLIRSAGTAWCIDCALEVSVSSRLEACPRCAGTQLLITGGEQMRVTEMEVD